jgi:hypothetical protein
MSLEKHPRMAGEAQTRRRSDVADYVQTDVNIEQVAEDIFSRYVGPQEVVIDGAPYRATFFERGYCPDLRVMKLAGELGLRVQLRAGREDGVQPLRVTIPEIMLAALLHDLGKQHEDCAPFLELLKQTDLRAEGNEGAERKDYLLGLVRDVHCRKGPCMIDRLRDAGRGELNNAFFALVARRHGEDYEVNRRNSWWAREINIITIADDYDAIVSAGPERAYKPQKLTSEDAARIIRAGVEQGRYEPTIAEVFISDVMASAAPE